MRQANVSAMWLRPDEEEFVAAEKLAFLLTLALVYQ